MAMNSYKTDEALAKKSKFSTMPRLFSYLMKYKGQVAVVLLLMAVGTTVDLINPLMLEHAVDNYIVPGDIGGLLKMVAIFVGLNIVMVTAIKIRMMVMARTSNRVILDIRQKLYEHIQNLDLKFFDSRPSGKILARIIGDTNSLKDIIENAVTTLIPNRLRSLR